MKLRALIREQKIDSKRKRIKPQIFSDIATVEEFIAQIPGDTIKKKMLYVLRKVGFTPNQITELRGISKSVIYREMEKGF